MTCGKLLVYSSADTTLWRSQFRCGAALCFGLPPRRDSAVAVVAGVNSKEAVFPIGAGDEFPDNLSAILNGNI